MPKSLFSQTHPTQDDYKRMPKGKRLQILSYVKDQYWMRGKLRYKCFPNGQAQLYDRIHQQSTRHPGVAEPIVALCHRRFGKSHLSALLCVERCLEQPGSEVHFGTDTKSHARQILEEKLFQTFSDMPRFISYRTRDNVYWFRNATWPKGVESMLVLEGLDYNLGGGMRGGKADLFIIDEAREIRHLEYVMKRVVTPMFKGRPNPTLVLCTTPPDSMDHDFTRIYIPRARDSNSLVVIPASQNPDWTEDDTRLMLNDYKSKTDIGWRREIECELISDTSRMIIPEWSTVRPQCVIDPSFPKPVYYSPYVSLDLGWKDHSAAVFAYYDFINNKLVVVDELFIQYATTEDVAELLMDKINKSFEEHTLQHLRLQGDGNALNLADINRALSKHSEFYVREVVKYDREAAINSLRSSIQNERILIHSNCQELDKQLLNGLWNARRTDFDRTKTLGHCDLIASLNYCHRNVAWGENVAPSGTDGWREGVCRVPMETTVVADTSDVSVLKSIFNPRRFSRRR